MTGRRQAIPSLCLLQSCPTLGFIFTNKRCCIRTPDAANVFCLPRVTADRETFTEYSLWIALLFRACHVSPACLVSRAMSLTVAHSLSQVLAPVITLQPPSVSWSPVFASVQRKLPAERNGCTSHAHVASVVLQLPEASSNA